MSAEEPKSVLRGRSLRKTQTATRRRTRRWSAGAAGAPLAPGASQCSAAPTAPQLLEVPNLIPGACAGGLLIYYSSPKLLLGAETQK